MNPLRILLADDHRVVREGLKTLLDAQDDMLVVGEAEDGKAACLLAKELQPDLVVMDINMPKLTGLQATEVLQQLAPHIKIVILTAHEDGEYCRLLLTAGASGYLSKNSSLSEVVKAVRSVGSGSTYIDPTLAGRMFRANSPYGGTSAETVKLSDRENEVLRLLAWGHTNKEIADQLHVSIHSVETYKARSMEKLGLKTRPDVVRHALRQGWLKET